MIKRVSFSLLELTIVVIMVAIIATFAIPGYYKAIEKTRGKDAEATLIAIYNAQKRYKLDSPDQEYFDCGGSCTRVEVKDNLGIEIEDTYFDYSIRSTGNRFTAEAKRKNQGPCKNKIMSVTDSGSQVIKGCRIW